MKKIISIAAFLILPIIARGQDSLICFTYDELKILTAMTEDLKWTKRELQVTDSIVERQRKIIALKDSMLQVREYQLVAAKEKGKKRARRAGIWAASIGLVLGLIGGYWL